MVRVVLVDDVPEILEVLSLMYECIPDVKVVATARNNDEALEILKATKADLISIDVEMGNSNGLDLCCAVHRTMPHVYITMCSSECSPENKRLAMSCGAQFFLEKPVHMSGIQHFIQTYKTWRNKQSSVVAQLVR